MHANLKTDQNKTVLVPMGDAAMKQCWINGEKLVNMKPVTLKPNDRIIFGTGSCFLFRNQARDNESGPRTDDPPITYEFALEEKMKNEEKDEIARKEADEKRLAEEAAAKMAEMQAKNDAEKAEQLAAQQKMQQEFEEQMKKM